MSYGKSFEKHPIKRGEIWQWNGSKIAVNDLTAGMPGFMFEADMIYTDPPWSLGNVNMFNSKSGREYMRDYGELYVPLFDHIAAICPNVCYLEIGKQNKNIFIEKLNAMYSVVQAWQICYYKKHPCYLLRGGHSPADFDYTGIDDEITPYLSITNEKPRIVGDLCMGRGITGMAALRYGCGFVGTELNKRKIAIFVERASKIGVNFENI